MQRFRNIATKLSVLFVVGSLFGVMLFSAAYLYLSPKLPKVETLREAKLQVPLRIYSQNGELIGEFGEKLRTPISLVDVPQEFILAILAAEDDRFLKHQGVDLAGLLRAASQLFLSGEIKTGGSTITMQVARNFFLSREKTFLRKFNEILLALQIERELDKGEILELYINKIYLGKRAYGFEAAAGVYYGQSLSELQLAQLAMLAGLPKAPSTNNPINNPERARERRNWILGRMLKLDYITQEDYQQAVNSDISARYHGPQLELDAGYIAEMARAFALDRFGTAAYTDGYKVITTIDGKQQRTAERAIRAGLSDYTERHGYRGAELSLADPTSADFPARAKNLLQQTRVIAGLHPAIVVNIRESSAIADETLPAAAFALGREVVTESNTATGGAETLELMLADGSLMEMQWTGESNPLRLYINENRRSPRIESLKEAISAGDMIRIEYTESGPKISQLPTASAALVAMQPSDGAIKALVGGLDFRHSKFNRVTQAYRQPGSNFKPFIYAAALENGFTAAHLVNDAPIVFDDSTLESDWRPENSSGKFYGPTTLRRALYLSRNLVSVRLLRELGISKAITYLQTLQLDARKLPRDLSLSLGSYAMTPLEIATAYSIIANGGFRVQPYLVEEIRDRNNEPVYLAEPLVACLDCNAGDQSERGSGLFHEEDQKAEIEEADSLEDLLKDEPPPGLAPRVMDARVAFIIDSILQDVIVRGTGTRAKQLGRSDLAGKTGTTNGPTDAWFSGYHPELVATAWLGFDNNQFLGRREFGGSAALPIWIDFMRDSLDGLQTAIREKPPGITAVRIDRLTGKLAGPGDSDTIFEFFREEYAPVQQAAKVRDTSTNNSSTLFDEELF